MPTNESSKQKQPTPGSRTSSPSVAGLLLVFLLLPNSLISTALLVTPDEGKESSEECEDREESLSFAVQRSEGTGRRQRCRRRASLVASSGRNTAQRAESPGFDFAYSRRRAQMRPVRC